MALESAPRRRCPQRCDRRSGHSPKEICCRHAASCCCRCCDCWAQQTHCLPVLPPAQSSPAVRHHEIWNFYRSTSRANETTPERILECARPYGLSVRIRSDNAYRGTPAMRTGTCPALHRRIAMSKDSSGPRRRSTRRQ